MVSSGPATPDDKVSAEALTPEPEEPLLKTKLFVPPLRPNRLPRTRLFEEINCGLDKALILISAPAGYGKTTLVSNWLTVTNIASAWISLDEDDNDPIRFLQYFITALQKIIPTIQLDLLGMLQDTHPPSLNFFLNILINKAADQSTPFVLILDDFHTIHAKPVLEMLTHLLDHLPPQMHMVLISRSDPPLPLARLRVRNQLIEIRSGQLRFTPEETRLFLNEWPELKLSTDDFAALEARNEGWIAGLQLASIALQALSSKSQNSTESGNDVHDFVAAFTGSHHYIMDYLVDEVLKLQPEPIRSFLLQSSILGRMCGSLCDEVVDSDPTTPLDGQAMLQSLEQMNLFIIPIDNERRWYRYHHLFADILNRHMEQIYPHQIEERHRRASRWYSQNGFISEAIQHACLSGDQECAAQLVDRNGCLMLMRGEVVNLLKWIEAVEPYSQTHPWIAVQKVWALCVTGKLDRFESAFQNARKLISSLEETDETKTMLGAVTAACAVRANMLGETLLAADLARQALAYLPASNDFSCSLRSVTTSILGDASWMVGDLAEAGHAYTQAVQISRTAGNIHTEIMANSNFADTLMEQGRLHEAAEIYSKTLQMATLTNGQISPLADKALAGLSRVFYEWNQLEAAEEKAQQGIKLAQRWGSIEFQATDMVILAGLAYAQGQSEKLLEAMQSAEQLSSQFSLTPWRTIWIKSALGRLWIFRGELERASDMLIGSGIPIDINPDMSEISHLLEPLFLILIRLHLARANYNAALTLSKRLRQTIDSANQRRIIETLILQALAHKRKRDLEQAFAFLEEAFALARPEGYIRTFLDEGEHMTKLLYQMRAQLGGSGYAAKLLSAIGTASGGGLLPAQLLIEPLTLRELELLKLIGAGYSNQQIAEKLVISLATVKRHISNIYAKLGVDSRTQAVARGKELDLFTN